jgi:hypothetical protein
MVFISPNYNNISIFDHINFNLLGVINCGSNISQPRDLIYIENQNMMIIASQSNYRLVFVRYYSPTNYTCLDSISLSSSGDPQALLKINETFFYVTTGTYCICVYGFHYDGHVWIQSLFANINQTLKIPNISLGHVQVDNLQRRWVIVVKFGVVVYDQWGSFSVMWKFGNKPFDIYISNDYRFVVSDYGSFSLILYEPPIIA